MEPLADPLAHDGVRAVDHVPERMRPRKGSLTSGEDAFLTHELVDRIHRACGFPPLA